MVPFRFETQVIHWRGPSPYFFAPIPAEHSAEISRVGKLVTYGWGMISVEVDIAGVAFSTSLFPKDGAYLLPLKDAVRHKANITAGDKISVDMTVVPARR